MGCWFAKVLARDRLAFEEGVVARFESDDGCDFATCRIVTYDEPLPDICAESLGILCNLTHRPVSAARAGVGPAN